MKTIYRTTVCGMVTSLMLFGFLCDTSKSVMLNNQLEYVLASPCDSVRFTSGTFGRNLWVNMWFSSGHSAVWPSEFLFQIVQADTVLPADSVKWHLLRDDLDGKKLYPDTVIVDSFYPDPYLRYRLSFSVDLSMNPGPYRFQILPSSFITCSGQSLIVDTIRLSD